MALPLYQAIYRWYRDDAALNSATALAAENTAITFSPNLRLRLRTKHYCITSSGNLQYKLQYQKNGGTLTDVPIAAGGDLYVTDSSNFTSHQATTEVLSVTTGTWTAGQAMDLDITTNAQLMSNKRTEFEWSLIFGDSAVGATYTFKAVCLSIGQMYNVVPSVTIKNIRMRLNGNALRIQSNKFRVHI
jgi:hypothetical protein